MHVLKCDFKHYVGTSTGALTAAVLGVLLSAQLLFYDYESLLDFVQQRVEIRRQYNLLRIDNHVRCGPWPTAGEPYGLAQPTLHPVAMNRSTDSSAYCQSDPESRKLSRS